MCFFLQTCTHYSVKTHQLQTVMFKDATSLDDVRVAVVDMYRQL